MTTWFDAHLDLAYLAVSGRDMRAPLNPNAGPHPPASITLPSLAQGNVRMALGTIFTEAVAADSSAPLRPEQYRSGDVERASKAGRAQMEVYLTWRDCGAASLDLRPLLRTDPGVGEMRGGMGVAETSPLSVEARLARNGARTPLRLGILIENADPVRSPEELSWWSDRGVVAIGLTWARPGRYAAGNASPSEADTGLTPLGRDMIAAMDTAGLAHDVSHLSDRSLHDLFEATDAPVIASHSNCRALLDAPDNQRHLTDQTIREITRRGGVIGLNLFRGFLAPESTCAGERRPSAAEAIAHVERVCELSGSRRHVGLGSDMDGGFSARNLPHGVNEPSDLELLLVELRNRGWNDDDVAGFTHRNFAGFFMKLWSGAG